MAQKLVFGDSEIACTQVDQAEIVILPVPYDQTSTWIKGADKGPEAICRASAKLEFYDILTDSEVWQKGIYTDLPLSGFKTARQMVKSVHQKIQNYWDRHQFPVVLGGEHSVSIGAIQATAEYCENLTILQLDAHADTRETYEGSAYNHACVMARAREVAPIVQVGIRSMDISEKEKMNSNRIFWAHIICNQNRRQWIQQVVSLLTENVYLTIDLDVFDPSVLLATGTPEPGGLSWYDVIELAEEIIRAKNLIGFDVVELCPREHLWTSDFLAAKLVYQLLSFQFRE